MSRFLLVLAFLFSIHVHAAAPQPQTSGALAQAIQALDSWNGQGELLDRAENILDRLLKDDPRNYRALRERARLVIMSGYMKSRCVDFRGHCYNVGVYTPGTLESAEAILKETLAIEPKFAEAYVLLGYVYTEQEKVQEAAAALRKAEEIGTDDPWLHLNWAALHESRAETALAMERWQKVLEKGTDNKKAMNTAYGRLVVQHRRDKRDDLAIETYRKMIALDPSNAWNHGNLGDMLGSMGRHDEAIAEARAALAIMRYGAAYQTLSWNLYAKWAELIAAGKRTEARPYFDEAHQIKPDLEGVMVGAAPYVRWQPIARALVKEKGISIDVRDKEGSTALLIAVNTNRNDAVKGLLAMGANPNVRDPIGWTPLISAADEGNAEVVKLLLDAGADRTATKANKTAEIHALAKNYPLIAKQIRDYKPQTSAKR